MNVDFAAQSFTPQRVLVVCTANVCRSPLAEFELRHALGELGPVEVISAGTRANDGDRMCGTSASALHEQVGGRDFIAHHRSHRLSTELIESADLVLTMTRDQRGYVAQLAPGSQSKTFTLEEAAALAELADASEPRRIYDDVGNLDVRLLATVLGGRRWRAAPSGESRKHNPLDIVDGHLSHRWAHRRTVRDVREAAGRLAGAFSSVRPLVTR